MGMIEKPIAKEFHKNLKFESIIDVKAIQSLMDDFYDLTNIGIAVLDLDGKVLVAKGWQDICVKFHRVHPETSKNCMESDLELSNGIEPGTFRLYRCKNNMLDMATPIVVGGHKIGNLYLGQFLFEDEPVNVDTFRLQAQKFGFEEDLYIEALEKVPRWSRQTVNTAMDFYTKFARLISELGYKNLELSQSVLEKENLLEKLKESEKKYRELVENLNDVVYAVDNEGNITYVSPSVETVLGYTNDQLIGRPFEQFIHPDDRAVVSAAFMDVLHNKLRPTEYRIRSKSAEFRLVRTSSRPIYRNGRVTGLQGVLTDITDRKQANAEIKTLNERLSIATDSAGIGVWELDLETDTLVWDDWMYRIYGIDPKRFQGAYETWKKGVHPDDLKRADGEVRQAIKGAKPFDTQFRIVRPDGEIRHIKAFARVLMNNDGFPVKMTGVNFDITHRKQSEAESEKLQAQLLQAQKMESVGRLAGGVAHDFNNNLAVIQGYTQLMLEDMNPEDSHHGELEQILNAANRSASLTRQLLAFARKQTISPKRLDLNDTVEGMLKMLRRLIGENIELIWRPGPNLWTIKMDPAQIDQMLANLCINARDAIEDVGKLTIETKNVTLDHFYCSTRPGFVPGQYAMLAVSDDGSGMDKATLEQIFEPFFTTKEVGKGTGLGLSTIYGIAKQNGGFTNVYSEPGKGTTFKIYIPEYQGDSTQSASHRSEKIPKGHGETILLVEDDISVLNLSKKMLERLGYAVYPTTRPDEAVEMAREYSGRIHLLMTDVVMPQMSGNDLARQITEIQPDIQTLFMSGYTANVIAHQGILDEGVNFIEKPFSINDLGRKIGAVLKKEACLSG